MTEEREHVLRRHDCWCEPRALQVCPFCEGECCPLCRFEGLVTPYDPERTVIYVHADGPS